MIILRKSAFILCNSLQKSNHVEPFSFCFSKQIQCREKAPFRAFRDGTRILLSSIDADGAFEIALGGGIVWDDWGIRCRIGGDFRGRLVNIILCYCPSRVACQPVQ